jgi:sugar phosphate isomerase/epimerase
MTVAGLALPHMLTGLADTVVAGVHLGVQTYSFREIPRSGDGDAIDDVIKAMTDCGLSECELWAGQGEPRFGPPPGGGRGRGMAPDSPEAQKAREEAQKAREALRMWRVETPIEHFHAMRRKFDAAGIAVYAYNYTFSSSFSDEEIDRGFAIAKALGAEVITASTTLPIAQRVVPFAEKHRLMVAMHNHSNLKDPNEFATPESFATAMKMSKYYKINLDIGHFTAANFDPIPFIEQHHEHITNLHLKDRKKDQGENTPWGQGDTPIREVLQLVKKEKWPIRAYIEYEYKGTGTPVEEVKKCVDYARQALT